jgi:drug/metabolite transporter (DMT)-like permease
VNVPVWLWLVGAALLAAVGQLLFRAGAVGRQALMDFVNPALLGGLVLYGISTVLWIYALSRAKLTTVYPFTALTFVLVYVGAMFVLGEKPTRVEIVGVLLVLAGLSLLAKAPT